MSLEEGLIWSAIRIIYWLQSLPSFQQKCAKQSSVPELQCHLLKDKYPQMDVQMHQHIASGFFFYLLLPG